MGFSKHLSLACRIPAGPGLSYHYYSNPSPATVGAADEMIDWRRLKSHLIQRSLIKGCVSGIKTLSALGLAGAAGDKKQSGPLRVGSSPLLDLTFSDNTRMKRSHSSTPRPEITISSVFPWQRESRSAALLLFVRVCLIMAVLCGQKSSARSPQLYLFYRLSSANHYQSASEGNPLCVSHRCHLGLISWN